MKSLINELNELKATLKADGYKDWCYAQLTIDKAIEVVKNCTIPLVSKCNSESKSKYAITHSVCDDCNDIYDL